MIISGCICVDEDKHDNNIQYLSIPDQNGNQRRIIYWRCAVVSFATSIRCNPQVRHILYTNDPHPVLINDVDAKEKLQELGVQVKVIPFEAFKPPMGFSQNFKNAFFKLDVIKQLSLENDTHNLLLDLDCVWIRSAENLINSIESGLLLLYDNYEMTDPLKKIHGMSMAEMGKVYQEIDPNYPTPYPILFGGEFIAGSNHHFRRITNDLTAAFHQILENYPQQPPMFCHQQSIFDNDEYLTSFVYNRMEMSWTNAKQYIRRINTDMSYSSARPSDMDLTIWHLLDEKTQGFPLLYKEVINSKSFFWKVPLDKLSQYLGGYLGIPDNVVPKRYTMLAGKAGQRVLKKIKVQIKRRLV
jgi:hypothetical protein